jgi:hypothetical protein
MRKADEIALKLVETIDMGGYMTFRDESNAKAAAHLIAQAILAARREALEAVRNYHKNMAVVCRKDMAKSRHPEVTNRLATLAHCHEQSEASIDGFEIG